MMSHGAITRVLTPTGTPNRWTCFVMEYVRGESPPLIASATSCLSDCLALFMQVCERVQHGHQEGPSFDVAKHASARRVVRTMGLAGAAAEWRAELPE
jgi:hypothetical protein